MYIDEYVWICVLIESGMYIHQRDDWELTVNNSEQSTKDAHAWPNKCENVIERNDYNRTTEFNQREAIFEQ